MALREEYRQELHGVIAQAVVLVRAEVAREWADCSNAILREQLWHQQKNLEIVEARLMEAIEHGKR